MAHEFLQYKQDLTELLSLCLEGGLLFTFSPEIPCVTINDPKNKYQLVGNLVSLRWSDAAIQLERLRKEVKARMEVTEYERQS